MGPAVTKYQEGTRRTSVAGNRKSSTGSKGSPGTRFSGDVAPPAVSAELHWLIQDEGELFRNTRETVYHRDYRVHCLHPVTEAILTQDWVRLEELLKRYTNKHCLNAVTSTFKVRHLRGVISKTEAGSLSARAGSRQTEDSDPCVSCAVCLS